ncbi:MAG TPA: hypothetical protein VFE62_15695 [Gemmataceae bacterium]|nr:hypothetical protein [Gemmataceae bacterium]
MNTNSSAVPARAIYKLLVLLLLFGGIAYCNSFTKVFLLDDVFWITNRPSINDLRQYLSDMHTRPLVAITLYMNHQLHGTNVFGYHLVNLAIHLLASVSLFGLVRRSLLLPRWEGRFDKSALWLAFAVALLWVVHPLQTQAVTYIIQRGESMMGLFFLLAMYCMVRGTQAERPRIWYAACLACCVLGSASKEVMATVLPVMLCYDRVFVANWREIIARRWGLYLGMAAIWGVPVLIALPTLFNTANPTSAGFGLQNMQAKDYWMTQAGVILHYLRLCFIPYPQSFSYRGWPVTRDFSEFWPAGLAVAFLLLTIAILLYQRHWLGFLGAWFFGVLSITCIVPLIDVAFEHRLYLPTAAISVLIVFGGFWLFTKTLPAGAVKPVGICAFCLIAVTLIVLTNRRNEDYRSVTALWTTVYNLYPDDIEAINNVAVGLDAEGKSDEAIAFYQKSPMVVRGHFQCGLLLCRKGQIDLGLQYIDSVMKTAENEENEWRAVRHADLGKIYWILGDPKRAEENLGKAIELSPRRSGPYLALGLLRMQQNKPKEAAELYRKGLDLDKTSAKELYLSADAYLHGTPTPSDFSRKEALFYALQAADVTERKDGTALDLLVEAYAANGMFKQASETVQVALNSPGAQANADWQDQLNRVIASYREREKQQKANAPK